ncbi:MAG: hypothetical protein RMJ53_04075 [Chitinophagales bacterium]|nr:hypothetical protein [Chitinophagales bacterium]
MPQEISWEIVLSKALQIKKYVELLEQRVCLLENELLETQKKLNEQTLKTNELAEQIKLFRLAQCFKETSEEEKSELKQKVNEMIRSIDLCIAQLSRHHGN